MLPSTRAARAALVHAPWRCLATATPGGASRPARPLAPPQQPTVAADDDDDPATSGADADDEDEGPVVPDSPREPTGGQPPGVREVGGPRGPEPTRYGDWARPGGRCTDF